MMPIESGVSSMTSLIVLMMSNSQIKKNNSIFKMEKAIFSSECQQKKKKLHSPTQQPVCKHHHP